VIFPTKKQVYLVISLASKQIVEYASTFELH
jgi:hypothetical protein